ncbi:MAG TPA: hypothetical protein DIS90_07675 [Cytophagales bacterium]|nr:hypothetical protein [Cytophagales bacterium]HCR54788.1 hypothetical protein [Cytophagales bacterium]
MSEYLRVLVVHRQVSVASDIKKQFDSAGWLVHMAQSGLDGLLAARKESFSLILSAIDLPVITGIEMVRGIRNFSFNVNTPAVFIDFKPEGDYETILNKLNASLYKGNMDDLSSLIIKYDPPKSFNDYLRIEP